jgi:hypothetical protein
MTDPDWEAAARRRLEHVVADTVSRVRDVADEIERQARRDIDKAAKSDRLLTFQTYPRAAGQTIQSVQAMVFNLRFDSLIYAANDAEAARTEKLTAIAERTSATAEADKLAGAVKALTAMRDMAKGAVKMVAVMQGAAEGRAEEGEDRGELAPKSTDDPEFRLSEILAMINDAARKVGVEGEIRS